jgi:NAD(P)-dependent dehydrogenase (short-subunit alcohol dehydrogenase family)
VATARACLSNGDGTEVQLLGEARASCAKPRHRGPPQVDFRGEFLHAFLTPNAALRQAGAVTQGGTEVRADGMEYTTWTGVIGRAACSGSRPRQPEPRGREQPAMSGAAGLHHRRVERHRPGAGPRYYRAGYRLALVARRGAEVRPGRAPRASTRARASGLPPTCATSPPSPRPAAPASRRQGLPDVVIANAGISVGIDTAYFEDLEVMRATFETNNLGMAATFQPFIGADARPRRRARLVGIASVAGIRGLPGHGAYCASKAAVISYCESLRGELRAGGVKVVTVLPGYIATPLTAKPLQHAVPDAADDFADRAFHVHRRRGQLPRDPVADGCGGQADACAAQRGVRPPAGGPRPQAPRGRMTRVRGAPSRPRRAA